jgi:hypothetical protein
LPGHHQRDSENQHQAEALRRAAFKAGNHGAKLYCVRRST